MTAVDPRVPLQIVVTSHEGAIDLDGLVELGQRAWRHNYHGKLRVLYDVDYYDWLLGGRDWFAVLALNEAGQPVGCMFSLLRTLSCRGELLPAAYSTGWAVDPAYRRTGISLRIWQTHRATLRQRGCVGISASHGGYSGTRAGVVYREAPGQHGVSVPLHTGAIWSRALTGKSTPPARSTALGMRRLCFIDGAYAQEDPDAPIDHRAFSQLLTSSSPLTFVPSENFTQLYLNSELTRSGTMWLEPGGGARCAVGFAMFTLALDDLQIGLIGRIQFLLSCGCDEEQTQAVLEAMCGFLQRSGCSSVSLVDQHGIAHSTLERCGFTKTPDEVTFSLWAPESLSGRCQELQSPCSLDFL